MMTIYNTLSIITLMKMVITKTMSSGNLFPSSVAIEIVDPYLNYGTNKSVPVKKAEKQWKSYYRGDTY